MQLYQSPTWYTVVDQVMVNLPQHLLNTKFGFNDADRANRGGYNYASTSPNILLNMVLLTILMVVTEEL